MRALTLTPVLFGLPVLSALVNTQFPHLLIPLNSSDPNRIYGTQKTGEVSNSVYTEVSFDVPGDNAATNCRINFHVNTNATKNAPRELSGDAPYTFNVTRVASAMDQFKDSWASHPAPTDWVATVTLTKAGDVTVDGAWFDCPKWNVAQFLLTPSANRALRYWWFELDYPASEGGPHGITLEMHTA